MDYYGHMTYFGTPNDQAAYYAGMPVEEYEYREDLISEDEQALYEAGQPHLDPETRDTVDYSDVEDPESDGARVLGQGWARLIPGASS